MTDDIKGAPEEGQAGEDEPRVADVLAEAWDEVEAKEADDEPEAEEITEGAPAGEASPEQEPAPEGASGEEPEPEGVGTSAPEHWSQADKDNFASLTEGHRDWFLDIRKSLEGGYQKKFEEVASFRRESEALDEVFKPHDEEIALSGSDRVGAIRQLLAAHRSLQEKPAETIVWLARQYGLDPTQLIAGSQEEVYEDPTAAAHIKRLEARVEALGGQVQSRENAEAERGASVLRGQIEAFRDAKDEAGRPRHPHFEKVRGRMGALMQAGAADDLDAAYDAAVWADPELRGVLQADGAKAREVKRKEEVARAKRASSNARSRPVTTEASVAPSSIKDSLEQAWEAHS